MSASPLLRKDDYWAIWIGAFILIAGIVCIHFALPNKYSERLIQINTDIERLDDRSPFTTYDSYKLKDELGTLTGSNQAIGKIFRKLTNKPGSWQSNPLRGLGLITTQRLVSTEEIEIAREELKATEASAKQSSELANQSNFSNDDHNEKASIAIEGWRSKKKELASLEKKANGTATYFLPWLLHLFFFMAIVFGLGAWFMETPFWTFVKGFAFVFLLAVISYLLAAQLDMKAIGFGYAAWAIILGLLISNTVGTPSWVEPGLRTEYYIKTGLVILGAEILLSKILAIGLPGIFVAWIVTPIVLVSTYWFGQRVLKISSKTLNMTVSADMSVCGVSAAVATAAACKASKEELTVAIGLSMIFTSVMMIVLPAFINYLDMPEVLGGAWIGGTIDATGAVVAAGAFLGEKALSVAATIKMIQNVLIGVIAFGVAVYFSTKVDNDGTSKVGWGEIWKRFPKFILGFIGASILFSFIYVAIGDDAAHALIDQGVIATLTKNIRGWLFCLAFVSIGLSINFKSLTKHFVGGKPLILYLCGQTFNLCLTLLMAYVIFYLVFPDITANI